MKRTTIPALILLSMAATVSAQTVINFDDVSAPALFNATTRLTNAYSAQGVTFQGPGGNDGLAILSAGTFAVNGESGANILAGNANPAVQLSDGGRPIGPETLLFSPPVDYVEIRAASVAGSGVGETFTLEVFGPGDVLLGSTAYALTNTLTPVSVAAIGIVKAVLTTAASVQIYDDLTFAARPANDDCANAQVVTPGAYRGSTRYAFKDGITTCGAPGGSAPDVWYQYTAASSGKIWINTAGSTYDTVLSVHSGCPGTAENSLNCNDDGGTNMNPDTIGTFQSALALRVTSGETYWIRIGGFGSARGDYVLSIEDPALPAPVDSCGWVPQFPSANSTVVAGGSSPNPVVESGYLWSRTDGHKIEETIIGDRGKVTGADFHFNVTTNYLANGVTLDLLINSTLVGIVSVGAGQTGPVTQSIPFFPAITGPNYTIKIEPHADVPLGEGAFTVGIAGGSQGFVVLKSSAASTTYNAVNRGWWDQDGNHTSTNNNTLTGRSEDDGKEYRSYFSFDVPRSYTAKSIILRLEIEQYFSADPSETFEIRGVSTSAATLEASGTGQTAIFDDLGDGPILGTFTVRASDVGSIMEIPLSHTGVLSLNFASSTPSIGIKCITIAPGVTAQAARFSASNEGRTHQLMYDYCDGPTVIPETYDFGTEDLSGWFGGVVTGAGGVSLNTRGICMNAPELGDNIMGWVSPASYCPLRDMTVYRMLLETAWTDQSVENAIPFLSFVYDNFPSNTYGGELLIMDNTGGGNGIGRPQGRTNFEMWAAPNAVETLQWRGLLDNGVPGENDNSAFTPQADAINDMRLVIRLNDIGSAGINANVDSGTVCIRRLRIRGYAVGELIPQTPSIYAPPINSNTHGAERFDQMGAGFAEIDDGSADVRYQLLASGLGARKTLFPWDRTEGAPSLFYPVPWESDVLLKGTVTVRSRVSGSEGTDPVDLIGVILDTATIETQVVHLTSRGNPGNMNLAASPRRIQSTGGVAQAYTGYLYTHNKTVVDPLISPGADRLRVQADFFNLEEIAPQGVGADPFAATTLKVDLINLN